LAELAFAFIIDPVQWVVKDKNREQFVVSSQSKIIAERAKAIYAGQLQRGLEANHSNRFVAIEPESGDHFLADTFSEAVALARATHPQRISFVIRIGHETAIHLGGMAK
jgi:hypothetical protein